ncbi:MAG TPA: citrate synthase [Candidatus Eisenbacteria bacterium]|jgi:citrate synthase|nr:citrate synthase [Candidatus Eisenbacteria bacterium]
MSERTTSTPAAAASPVPYIPGLDGVPAARSSICWIDGDQGVLEYRGYPIETLAEKSTFEETSYLLLWGKLPNRAELEKFSRDLRSNRDVRFRLIDLLKCLPDTGHPMEALQASIAALGMFYPDRDPMKPEDRYNSSVRLIAKAPTLVAAFHRLSLGKDYIPPREDLSHAANFLYMLTGDVPEEDEARVMDICFILHAEHSMNASTFGGRVTASTLADPYTVISSAIGALTGPLHGGANEQVIHMLQQIGDAERARPYIEDLIHRKQKIMGIGHRIYRVKDPRALVLQRLAGQMISKGGGDPLLAVAQEVEKVTAEHLGAKRIYPNVDFYSGVLYTAMGLPAALFTPMFAIARVSGWLAHWLEQIQDNRIYRPDQIYTGTHAEPYIPMEERV